jgi:hypothetical protein
VLAKEPGTSGIVPQIAMNAAGEATVAWSSPSQAVTVATRSAADSYSNPVMLTGSGESTGTPAVAIDEQGDSEVVWMESNGFVEGSTESAGGKFGEPVRLSSGGKTLGPVSAAMDSQGDGVSSWVSSEGANDIVQLAGYQATGPSLEMLQAPTEGQAGDPLAFSVSPLSVWSTIASTTWSWGDGSPDTSGTGVTHVFDAAGTYQVSVSATDALGNATNATRTVTIQAAPTVHTNPKTTPTLPKAKAKPKPKAKEAAVPVFTPLFATKAAIGGSTLGLFIGIASVRGARAGDTIVVRCTAGCQRPLHETVHVGKHHNARGTIAISPPLVVSQTTRVEIEVLAPGRVPRFVQYRFIRAGGKLIAHPTRKGCLPPGGRARSCT